MYKGKAVTYDFVGKAVTYGFVGKAVTYGFVCTKYCVLAASL